MYILAKANILIGAKLYTKQNWFGWIVLGRCTSGRRMVGGHGFQLQVGCTNGLNSVPGRAFGGHEIQ